MATIIFVILLVLPWILTYFNILNLFLQLKHRPRLVDGLIITLGPLLTLVLFSCWNTRDYDEALKIPIDIQWHTPIASWHSTTIIVLCVLGIAGYLVVRVFKLKLPPLAIVLCISCMIIGSTVAVLWILQLSKHIFGSGMGIPGENLYLSLFPFNYIICCISVTKDLIAEYASRESAEQYENKVLSKFEALLRDSRNWPVMGIILMIPILAGTLLILVLFGQQPSAVIKAFTETSDWLLSQKISPPPVHVNAHYLCTVSLRGHRSVVKPLRYGIRGGEKIVVNRQLCVANAFEQLIQERTPRAHRLIRYIYDKYGYPLSKHIVSPLSADVVYVLMKPLEWIFVVVLYLLDNRPEDRIARQYIPKEQLNDYITAQAAVMDGGSK